VVHLKSTVSVGVQIRGLVQWVFVQELIHCCHAVFACITSVGSRRVCFSILSGNDITKKY